MFQTDLECIIEQLKYMGLMSKEDTCVHRKQMRNFLDKTLQLHLHFSTFSIAKPMENWFKLLKFSLYLQATSTHYLSGCWLIKGCKRHLFLQSILDWGAFIDLDYTREWAVCVRACVYFCNLLRIIIKHWSCQDYYSSHQKTGPNVATLLVSDSLDGLGARICI